MPAANTLSYHVFGPIIPQADVGSARAYVNLGVCEEGADIDIQVAKHDVKHDGGGGTDGFETDKIFLNAIVTVRFRLVPFAGNYINVLRARAHGSGSTDGLMVMPGTLMGEGGFFSGLYLPVTAGGNFEGDGPWFFPSCDVVRPGNNRVSTKESKLDFEFRAINYFAVASSPTIFGNYLYKRSAPP